MDQKNRYNFTLHDSDYAVLSQLAKSSGKTISVVLGELIPTPAMFTILEFCRSQKLLSTDDWGGMAEELLALGMINDKEASDWLQHLVSSCTKNVVDAAMATGGMKPQELSVKELLLALRSNDFSIRLRAGFLLAQSAGAGFAARNEKREDVEHTIGRDISKLIGLAQSGDKKANTELEKCLSNQPA